MRIAVVGGGLAGLGTTHFLIQKGYSVTLFDERGIGGGASGIPIGLCHPYVGRSGKPSKFSEEALLDTIELLDIAEKFSGTKLADRSGILRTDWVPLEWYPDLEKVEDGVLIKSGMTIFLKEYVEALYASFQGVALVKQAISSEDQLKQFDKVIFTCGAGSKDLGFQLPMTFVKGQVLIGRSKNTLLKSVMKEKGHLSPMRDGWVQLGSTYEHHYTSFEPIMEVAISDLSKKLNAFFPNREDFSEIKCSSGVRACVKDGYLPIVSQISEKSFVFTGLGSRGLLYHAYYGRHLADLVQ